MKLFTPFYGKQVEYGGKMVDLAGWQMAEVYTTVEEEYHMIRDRASFTDYSFQCSLAVVGKGAFDLVQKVIANDLRKISPGRLIYSSILDETAAVIDDTTVFWVEKDFFIINGGLDKQRTMEWLNKHKSGIEAYVIDIGLCFLALQGPKSREVLSKAVNLKDLPYFHFRFDKLGDIPIMIARAGFSGELGYEVYVRPEYAHDLWDKLIELGQEYNVGPYGLTVSFPLGVEVGYLSPWDFYEGGTLLEYGLGWTIGWNKEDFIGKEVLVRRKKENIKTKLVGFEVADPKVVAAPGDKLMKDGKVVGQVTAAAYGWSVKKSLGRARVDIEFSDAGQKLQLEHGDTKTEVITAKSYKWYDPERKRVKG
jgi:aminomethyltransferase